MKIAVVGVGVAGAYLMNRLPPEHHVEAFEMRTEKNWWTVCAWGTSEPFIADLVKQAGFNFEDYVLHRGKKMVVDLGDEQLEIPLKGLVTYDKHKLTHDMLEGKVVHWGEQVKQVNDDFSGFDMVVDATGLQRSLLPKVQDDLVIPSLEYEVKSKEIPYDDFVIKPYPGLCVTSDTLVMANPGVKKINEVKVGESVLTKAGWKAVEEVYSREYSGTVFDITPFLCGFPVGLTPDHLVWVLDRKTGRIGWKPASQIRECHSKSTGDYVAMPIPHHDPVGVIRIADYVDGILRDGRIRSKGRNQYGSVFGYRQSFSNEIRITEEFGEFIGFYISEGNAFHDGIILTNYNKKIYRRMKFLGEQLFGIEGKKYFPNQVQFNSTILKRLFISLFGEGAHFKQIPPIALGFPLKVRIAMIRSLFKGDGGKERRGKYDLLSYTTRSKTLAFGLWQLLLSVGIVSSVAFSNASQSYRIRVHGSQLRNLGDIFGRLVLSKSSRPPRKYVIKDGVLYFAVRKVAKREVRQIRVHDMRTNGSYVTSFLVHNSGYWWWFPLGDGRGHVGAGDLKGRYRYELDEFVKKYHCEVVRRIGRPVRVTPPKLCGPFYTEAQCLNCGKQVRHSKILKGPKNITGSGGGKSGANSEQFGSSSSNSLAVSATSAEGGTSFSSTTRSMEPPFRDTRTTEIQEGPITMRSDRLSATPTGSHPYAQPVTNESRGISFTKNNESVYCDCQNPSPNRPVIVGVGESIGTVYPMLGEGIIPSMQCVNLLVENLFDLDAYTSAVLDHFAIYAKVYEFIKAKVENRFSLMRMWPTLLSIFWYMRRNERRYGLETNISDFYKIVTRL